MSSNESSCILYHSKHINIQLCNLICIISFYLIWIIYRVPTGQEKVRKNWYFLRVRKKSGNFTLGQEILVFCQKVRKKSGKMNSRKQIFWQIDLYSWFKNVLLWWFAVKVNYLNAIYKSLIFGNNMMTYAVIWYSSCYVKVRVAQEMGRGF